MKKLFWMLLGTGFSIAAIAFTLSDDILSYFFNLLLGLSTNIFGMIITIFFAQKYIDATEAKNRKAAEANEILRHDRIMQQFIWLYLEGYASITIPNKQNVSEVHINAAEDDEFELADLAGMYDVSLMVQKKDAKSSIEIYYENEDKLAKYVMEVIENVNFDFYPELLNILIEFYKIYIKSDEREIILWPLTVDNLDNRKLIITAMSDMIKSNEHDWIAQDANGKLNGNVMKSYVALFLKVREERKLIAEYTQEINKLKSQNGQS